MLSSAHRLSRTFRRFGSASESRERNEASDGTPASEGGQLQAPPPPSCRHRSRRIPTYADLLTFPFALVDSQKFSRNTKLVYKPQRSSK